MKTNKKDNIGLVYCFSTDLYAKEGLHKIGCTQNPLQRRSVQSNAAPPCYPLKDEIIVLTKDYKSFESKLKTRLKGEGLLLCKDGKVNGGSEWLKCENFERIVEIFKELLPQFDNAYMCSGNTYYKCNNGKLEQQQNRPNCQLSLLGFVDGDTITCKANGCEYVIKGNGILDEGKEYALSTFMETYFPRKENQTQNYNGFQHFTFKGKILNDMWISLTDAAPNKNTFIKHTENI